MSLIVRQQIRLASSQLVHFKHTSLLGRKKRGKFTTSCNRKKYMALSNRWDEAEANWVGRKTAWYDAWCTVTEQPKHYNRAFSACKTRGVQMWVFAEPGHLVWRQPPPRTLQCKHHFSLHSHLLYIWPTHPCFFQPLITLCFTWLTPLTPDGTHYLHTHIHAYTHTHTHTHTRTDNIVRSNLDKIFPKTYAFVLWL